MACNKTKIMKTLFFAVISVLFLGIFSLSTTPLYMDQYISHDSDVFLLMGKFASEGMTPYVDFFDHKGPFIIFLQWLGFSFAGKTGVFIIQAIFLTLTLCGIYKIAGLYCSNKTGILICLISLLIINTYFDKGNLTEEYCLPFIVWGTYLILKESDDKKWNPCYLVLGLGFMVGALTRLTNSLPIVVLSAVGLMLHIKNREWKLIGKKIGWFILGNLVLLVPTLIYFIKVGALKEMLNATFIYNLHNGFEKMSLQGMELVNIIALAIPLIIGVIVGVVAAKKHRAEKLGWILLADSLLAVAMVVVSRPYAHYLLIWLVSIVLTLICLINQVCVNGYKNKSSFKYMILIGVIVLIGFVKIGTAGIDIYKSVKYEIGSYHDKEALDIISTISEEDRDKVVAYDTKSRFYLATDIKPCYKNFTYQGIHGVMDEEQLKSISKDLLSFEAKYIVTATTEGPFAQWIEENYELEKSNNLYRLYVRK